jgi:hypothetical protein
MSFSSEAEPQGLELSTRIMLGSTSTGLQCFGDAGGWHAIRPPASWPALRSAFQRSPRAGLPKRPWLLAKRWAASRQHRPRVLQRSLFEALMGLLPIIWPEANA